MDKYIFRLWVKPAAPVESLVDLLNEITPHGDKESTIRACQYQDHYLIMRENQLAEFVWRLTKRDLLQFVSIDDVSRHCETTRTFDLTQP